MHVSRRVQQQFWILLCVKLASTELCAVVKCLCDTEGVRSYRLWRRGQQQWRRKKRTFVPSVKSGIFYQDCNLWTDHSSRKQLIAVLIGINPSFILKNPQLKMIDFWDVAPCSIVEVCSRFRGTCCLHHQVPGDGGSKNLQFTGDCVVTLTNDWMHLSDTSQKNY
jgi:hypothetical protein